MIFIAASSNDYAPALHLVRTLPRSLSTCIRRYDDRKTDMLTALERPVQAFLAAVDRFHALGHIWVLAPDLVYTKKDSLSTMFSLLDHADMVFQPDRADVVGFAPTATGFSLLAWWAHACLEWPGQDGGEDTEDPVMYLLSCTVDRCQELEGRAALILDPPLVRIPSMWPEVV